MGFKGDKYIGEWVYDERTGEGKYKNANGDIYIVNSEPDIASLDDSSIVPWNQLFVNNWGDTDAPLVSVSLKEEKHQLGRAKSYLNKFVDNKGDFNIDKKDLLALTTEELQNQLDIRQRQVKRFKSMLSKNVISQNEYDNELILLSKNKSDYVKSKISLEKAKEDLADTILKSEFNGRLLM